MSDMSLSKIPLFSGLDEAQLAALAKHIVSRNYPKNVVLINEGDESNSLYIILSGKVKAFLRDESGKEVILSFQGAGEYFGEMALIDNQSRSASIMTVEAARFSVITKEDFLKCLAENPEISLRLIRDLTLRLRQLTDNVKSLALMDVYGRVARTLLSLAEPTEEEGKMVVNQKLTQQDIANMVGASREMVTRILKDLTTGGYIQVTGKSILINNRLPPGW